MTFDSVAQTLYGGRPAELYRFVQGTNIWRYTNSDADVVIGTETYLSGWPITRNEPEVSNEPVKASLKVETSRTFPISALFIPGAPYVPVWISVFATNIGDLDTVLLWSGKVKNVSWDSSDKAIIDADPVDVPGVNRGMRQTFGLLCPHKLYSPRCGASENDFVTVATITSMSSDGLTLEADAFGTKASTWFRMGEIYQASSQARALVVEHSGTSVTLRQPIRGLEVGDEVHAFAGCAHTIEECAARFANHLNHGGWPYRPHRNLYETGV